MRSPLAAWRAGMRWPLVVLLLLTAIVVAVAVCEALGWPFLVAPVQRSLAKALDRRVVFSDGSGEAERVRIGLIGSVRVKAGYLEIGSPAWSKAPHMLAVRDASLKLGYLDLWRVWQGGSLNIESLEAAELDSTLERLQNGRASWQFGEPKSNDAGAKPAALPTFGTLQVSDGHVAYRDELLPAHLDARFALSDGSGIAATSAAASAGQGISLRAGGAASGAASSAERVTLPAGQSGFRLNAVGQYQRFPLRIDLGTAGVLGLLAQSEQAQAQPLKLLASVGGAKLSFEGTTTDPLHFTALSGRFGVSGASLGAVGAPLGLTLPTTPPFETGGSIVKDAGVWKAVFDKAEIGSSSLEGAFTYDPRPKVPLLSGRLGGSRLVLADLGPAIGAPGSGVSGDGEKVKAKGRVIPDKRFDLPSLRAMDANVNVEIAMFDPGTKIIDPLRPLRAHILLADGILTIADFEGKTAQGSLVGFLQLDGRGNRALWTADMRMLDVDLTRWLNIKRSGSAPPYISGKLDGQVKVKGDGRSTAEILSSLNGDIRFHLRGAAISHLALEAGGIDVAQALGVLVKGDDALPIECNVADLGVAKGVVRPKVFVLTTKDSAIWIDGSVSLASEAMDLRAVVSPKDFSPLTLRTPVHVKGTLGSPSVSVEMGKLATKAGAAVLLGLLNPLAAIIPFIDTGSDNKAKEAGAECRSLVKTRGSIAKPVRTPKNVRVPAAAAKPSASQPR